MSVLPFVLVGDTVCIDDEALSGIVDDDASLLIRCHVVRRDESITTEHFDRTVGATDNNAPREVTRCRVSGQ